MTAAFPNLVSVDWLANNLDDVKVVDGTWAMPADRDRLLGGFIPGAQSFDLDAVSTPHPSLNHMLPSADMFSRAISDMGISESDHVVIYDRLGLFSAPRLWWTFRMFGHERISVLDGGLPAWIKASHSVDAAQGSALAVTCKPQAPLSKVTDKAGVLKALGTETQIIDARPAGRFYGTTPEPRADLRGGHMPGALSIPYGALLTADKHLKPVSAIRATFADVDLSRPIITTCGSGITAAGLAFILHGLGARNISVYDGSWAEWGADPDVPIVTGET